MRKPRVTNGNWWARPQNYADFTGKQSAFPYTITNGVSNIAEIDIKAEVPEKVCLANAMLMAAAPEMLETLIHIRKIFKLDVKSMDMIDAALEKAGVK